MIQQQDFWVAGGASVLGSSHKRSGLPNQDAQRALPSGTPTPRVILAVSDGHGSSPSFRSDVGAQLAVDAACEVLDWFLDDPDVFAAVETLPKDLVQAWRGRVDAYSAAEPLPCDRNDYQYLPYGATIVAVGITAQLLIAIQIGDGDLLLGFRDESITRPIGDDQGLVGEQTYSLCLDDAPAHARVYVLERSDAERWPDFIFLSTDGISKSFKSDADFSAVGESYRALAQDDFTAAMAGAQDWLTDVTHKGSGDDATLCLAVRQRIERATPSNQHDTAGDLA